MKYKGSFRLLIMLTVIFVTLAGCSTSTKSKLADSKHKLQVVTTFYPMYEFTKNIAGDKADVKLLIPSNVEPHDWDPAPKDVGEIQDADVFIYNSKYMETWVPNIQKTMNHDAPIFVAASKGISFKKGVAEDGTPNEVAIDPHVWLSPVLAQKEVQNITKSLVKADPKNKKYYEKHSAQYMAKLKELDHEYRTQLKHVKKREIITQHAAFGYLAATYGLKQVPIAGLSPDQEPSAARLAELKSFAQAHHVKVIYFEELASPKVAKTLANEIGAKTDVLNTLEGLSTADQKKGLNYITEMKQNLKKLVQSLNE